MHMVMKHWDIMIGCDWHMMTVPPAPPVGPGPYFVMQFMSGLLTTVKLLPTQRTLYGQTVEKGTDIGMGIPHVGGPSVTLPIEIAFSASKSHWGSASYKVEGKNPALALVIAVNPNLNCGTPCPTPLGFVVCVNTHMAGMSLGDYLAGAFTMVSDFIIQSILNLVGSAIGKKLVNMRGVTSGRIGEYLANAAYNNAYIKATIQGLTHNQAVGSALLAMTNQIAVVWAVAESLISTEIGLLLGSPLGVSIGNLGLPPLGGGQTGDAAGGWADGAGQALGDYLQGGNAPNY